MGGWTAARIHITFTKKLHIRAIIFPKMENERMGVQSLFEIILYVEDMASMVAFYRDVMGFRVKNLLPDADFARQFWVEFAVGGDEALAQLVLHGGGGKQPAKDAPTMGFLVDDVPAMRDALIERGASLGDIRHPTPGSVVCDGRDPEGNRFSIFTREQARSAIPRKLFDMVLPICLEIDNPFFDETYIYRMLDVISTSNPALANPDRHPHHFDARRTPLTGEEPVNGDLFTFDYCGHDESMYLREHASLSEVEAFITSDAGITNLFTDHLIVIAGGHVKHYEMTYLKNGQRVRFSQQEAKNSPPRSELKYESLQVIWLD